MNKTELIAAVAEKAEISKKDSRESIKSIYRRCDRRVKERRKDSVSRIWYF